MKNRTLTRKNRIWEIDFFRGISILLVCFDHLMYDFARAFPFWKTSSSDFLRTLQAFGEGYLEGELRFFWRPAFLFVFFFTSGLCTAFSRNNFFRGIRLAAVALFVSVGTYILNAIMPSDIFVLFGVLHCLATIILLFTATYFAVRGVCALWTKIFKKEYSKSLEKILLSAVCIGLGIAFCFIHKKFNVSLYDVHASYATIETDSKILGMFFYADNWWTADYFPLFPFIGFFFLGAGCSNLIYWKRKSLLPKLDGIWHVPFTFAGRYSLIVFVGGQIIAVAFCGILSLIITGSLF